MPEQLTDFDPSTWLTLLYSATAGAIALGAVVGVLATWLAAAVRLSA